MTQSVLPADPTKNKGYLKDMVVSIKQDNTYTSKRYQMPPSTVVNIKQEKGYVLNHSDKYFAILIML